MNDMAAPAGEYAFKDARFAQSALQTQLRYKGLSSYLGFRGADHTTKKSFEVIGVNGVMVANWMAAPAPLPSASNRRAPVVAS